MPTSLAGDFDYELHGQGYSLQRRPDPRIAALIHAALGDGRTVLNVGAGAGSYEPEHRQVFALEPSASMRAQRPAHLSPAIHGVAEALPFDDGAVDASMATITIHQWSDWRKGVRELRRVTRGPVVVMTFDREALHHFWLAEYAPEVIEAERRRYPAIEAIVEELGGSTEVRVVQIPIDCTDGFTEAFYARPERMLDPKVRKAQSAWGFVADGVEERCARALEADLKSGAWDERHGRLRQQPFYEGSLRLIIGRPAA